MYFEMCYMNAAAVHVGVNSWAVPIIMECRDTSRLLLISDFNMGKVQREVNGKRVIRIADTSGPVKRMAEAHPPATTKYTIT
jgi:hypothetical protein